MNAKVWFEGRPHVRRLMRTTRLPIPTTMNRSTATGLAGGGALITMVSLLAPWYVLRVGGIDSGLGKSGTDALGALALLVVALAIAAGLSSTARAHALLPPLAAAALALVVLIKLLSPPAAGSVLGPNTGDALESEFAEAFANVFSSALGLHYDPTWGIWLAAAGAGATLAGTIAGALLER
jgi:hypothetical protein